MELLYLFLYCAFVMMIIGVLLLLRFKRTETLTRSTFIMPLGAFIMASGMVTILLIDVFVGFVVFALGGTSFLVGAIPYSYHQYLTYKKVSEQWERKNSIDQPVDRK